MATMNGLKYKPDFERAQNYVGAFWNKEIIDRPLVCVTAPMNRENQRPMKRYVYLQNMNSEEDYRCKMEEFEEIAAATYYGGEAMPSFHATFGPDQYAAFMGAKIHYANNTGTSWVDPCLDKIAGANIELDDRKGSLFDKYLEFSRYFTQYSKGKFFQIIADLHGNMDCLSAMRSPMNICYDIKDHPEEVMEALEKVLKTYPRIVNNLFDAADTKNRGSCRIVHCKGRMATVQCDFSCMLSPEDARRFVIPAVEMEASCLDHSQYHFDGKDALGHLDDILAIPKLDFIQFVPGAGQPRSVEWLDVLKRIQASGKGLYIYDWKADEIRKFYKELRPEGLLFSLHVSTPAEAEDLLEWLIKNT